jgi:hypothetical protein
MSIAYQVVGNGLVDLLMSLGFLSHLDLQWTGNAPKRAPAASEFSVERWAHRPLRRKTPQSGRGGETAEPQLWSI